MSKRTKVSKHATLTKKELIDLDTEIQKNVKFYINSLSSIRIDYGILYKNDGFKTLGTTRPKYKKQLIEKSDAHSSTVRRILNAAELDVYFGLKPNAVSEYVLRKLYAIDEADRKKVWELACRNAKGEYPTGKEVEAVGMEFFSSCEKERKTNSNSKKPVLTYARALKEIKAWDNIKLVKRVIRNLSKDTETANVSRSIMRNLTEKEVKKLIKTLNDVSVNLENRD